MKLGKRVQQIKVERGISFPDARKAVRSEQSANTSSKRTATSVILYPQNLSYSLHEAGVVTTGGIDSNPVWKYNQFLAHQSANVGSRHRSRSQRCSILYVRQSLCRRLRPVSARVRSLVAESYLGCGRCWFNTPLWP